MLIQWSLWVAANENIVLALSVISRHPVLDTKPIASSTKTKP